VKGSDTIAVADNATGLATLTAPELALANSVTMTQSGTLSAPQAELLAAHGLVLAAGVSLTISDTAANLLDAAYAAGLALATHFDLSQSGTIDTAQATALETIVGANLNLGANVLTVSDTGQNLAAASTVIAALHATPALSADALDLTPTQYVTFESEGVSLGGHAVSAELVHTPGDTPTDNLTNTTLSVTGLTGETVNAYDATGTAINIGAVTTDHVTGIASVILPDTADGANSGATEAFSLTETVNHVESAPLVVLNHTWLTDYLATVNVPMATTAATNNAVHISGGGVLDIYTSEAAAQSAGAPSLWYDAAHHNLYLETGGAGGEHLLITLGGGAPATLSASEIVVVG
jgi:hypothetical protein